MADDYLITLSRDAAHVLVSGDADLLGLSSLGFPVVSPRAFLDALG